MRTDNSDKSDKKKFNKQILTRFVWLKKIGTVRTIRHVTRSCGSFRHLKSSKPIKRILEVVKPLRILHLRLSI